MMNLLYNTRFALFHRPSPYLNGCKLPLLARHNYGYASLGLKAFARSGTTWNQGKSAKRVYISIQPQAILAAPTAGFVHRRNNRYASSQEPSAGTHRESLYLTDGDI